MRVLVVDADQIFARSIAKALRDDGFVVDPVGSLEDARDAACVAPYDAVLIDRCLPDGDGLTWVREQRRAGNAAPILIVTASLGAVAHRIEGLNAGADDYIIKPTPTDEVVARIRAVLRRPASSLTTVLRAGNVEFDTTNREIRVAGRPQRMPRRETCIFEMLIRRAGKTVAKTVLEEGLYSFEEDVSSNAIEVGIYRLRGHLIGSNATARIRTVRGVGYVLEGEEETRIEVPEAALLAARVAVALSKGSAASSVVPAIATSIGVAAKPETQVAVVAAALAVSMTRQMTDEGRPA